MTDRENIAEIVRRAFDKGAESMVSREVASGFSPTDYADRILALLRPEGQEPAGYVVWAHALDGMEQEVWNVDGLPWSRDYADACKVRDEIAESNPDIRYSVVPLASPPAPEAPEESQWVQVEGTEAIADNIAARLAAPEAEPVDMARVLELERTAVAATVTEIHATLARFDWLTTGRGAYEWDDDRWHDEFRNASEKIAEAVKPLEKIAQDFEGCPQDVAGRDAALRAYLMPEAEPVALVATERVRQEFVDKASVYAASPHLVDQCIATLLEVIAEESAASPPAPKGERIAGHAKYDGFEVRFRCDDPDSHFLVDGPAILTLLPTEEDKR